MCTALLPRGVNPIAVNKYTKISNNVHSVVSRINNGNSTQSSTTIYLLTTLIKVHVLANYAPFSGCKQLKRYIGCCISLCNIQHDFIVIFYYLKL